MAYSCLGKGVCTCSCRSILPICSGECLLWPSNPLISVLRSTVLFSNKSGLISAYWFWVREWILFVVDGKVIVGDGKEFLKLMIFGIVVALKGNNFLCLFEVFVGLLFLIYGWRERLPLESEASPLLLSSIKILEVFLRCSSSAILYIY